MARERREAEDDSTNDTVLRAGSRRGTRAHAPQTGGAAARAIQRTVACASDTKLPSRIAPSATTMRAARLSRVVAPVAPVMG